MNRWGRIARERSTLDLPAAWGRIILVKSGVAKGPVAVDARGNGCHRVAVAIHVGRRHSAAADGVWRGRASSAHGFLTSGSGGRRGLGGSRFASRKLGRSQSEAGESGRQEGEKCFHESLLK